MDRIGQLRKFIAASPQEAFPRYALALELKGQGDGRAAAAELEELLRIAPEYLAAYLQLGLLLPALDRASDARRILAEGQQVARRQANTHTLSELTQALEDLASR
jgi:tetratricopeptide (TPR) repeat protein